MPSAVLPLRAIAFQCLFLLMTVAIEAFILRRELKITPRVSIEYALSINLLSTATGWLVFFSLEQFIPPNLKIQLINCVFFDQWSRSVATWVIPTGFATFFISFLVKLQGLNGLQALLQEQTQKPQERRLGKSYAARRAETESRGSGQANAVLVANSLSYSAILLVIFFRLIVQAR